MLAGMLLVDVLEVERDCLKSTGDICPVELMDDLRESLSLTEVMSPGMAVGFARRRQVSVWLGFI
jgi:hypothetical protein